MAIGFPSPLRPRRPSGRRVCYAQNKTEYLFDLGVAILLDVWYNALKIEQLFYSDAQKKLDGGEGDVRGDL